MSHLESSFVIKNMGFNIPEDSLTVDLRLTTPVFPRLKGEENVTLAILCDPPKHSHRFVMLMKTTNES